MNKSAVKGAALFLSGGAIGSVVTFLVTRKVVRDRERRIADEKVASMQRYVDEIRSGDRAEQLAKELGYDASENASGSGSSGDQNKKNEKSSKGPSGGNNSDPDDLYDYSRYYKGAKVTVFKPNEAVEVGDKAESEHPRDDDEDDIAYQDAYALTAEANSSKGKPRIVSREEFDDPEYNHMDKIDLYYYTEDQILADDADNAIDDIVSCIGNALTKYGFNNNNEEILYVRNANRGTDYRIEKVYGAYREL